MNPPPESPPSPPQPSPELRAQFEAIIRKAAEGQERIRPVLQEMARNLAPYRLALENLRTTLAPYAEQFQRAVAAMAPTLVTISKAVERMPERISESVRALARNGWYIDPGMLPSEVFERAGEFKNGAGGDAHRKLQEYFDASLDEVERSLCERAPDRAKFFRSALNAHRRGDFAASIPLLLAQADGLCWDITSEQLYARRDGRPKLAQRLVANGGTTLDASMLVALIEPTPISAGTAERRNLVDILNRHVVLHGESLDYDTRLNSCRAISLVAFVSWALKESLLPPATGNVGTP